MLPSLKCSFPILRYLFQNVPLPHISLATTCYPSHHSSIYVTLPYVASPPCCLYVTFLHVTFTCVTSISNLSLCSQYMFPLPVFPLHVSSLPIYVSSPCVSTSTPHICFLTLCVLLPTCFLIHVSLCFLSLSLSYMLPLPMFPVLHLSPFLTSIPDVTFSLNVTSSHLSPCP